MNTPLPSLPSDWLAMTVRWLFMALIPVTAVLFETMDGDVMGVLLGWIGFSLIASLLRLIRWRAQLLDVVSIAVDTILGLGLIALTGWQFSPFWWSLLMPTAQISLRRGLRSGGLTLMGALVLGLLLSMGANQFSLWALAESLLQAALVALGGLLLSLPARWLLISMRIWRSERDQTVQRELLQDRGKVGQLAMLSAEINAALDPSQIASLGLALCIRVLDEAAQSAGQHVGAVYVHREGQLVRMASTIAEPGDRVDLTVKLEDVPLEEEAVLVDDPSDEPVTKLLRLNADWCECILSRLKTDSQNWGLLVIGHPAPRWFGQEELALVEAIARQMGVALTNAHLYGEIVAERDRINEIQEEVRKKLARDLHDGPTQVVAAIAMRANFARRLLGRDRDKAASELLQVEQMARRTTKEIRHMLFTLRPLILESQGLIAALNQLVDKTAETHDQLVYLERDSDLNTNLGLERESVVFFIAEEAINNARKHAAAAHIWVRLMQEGGQFVLEVEDDGAGFNVGEVDRDYEQRGSLGMVNMRERAELVNGDLHIESTEGVGTLVRLKVPMTGSDHQPQSRQQAEPGQVSEQGDG